MVVIRLTRVGKKNSPAYRVAVAEKRRAVKRKFIEVIGHYNPTMQPKEIVIDKDRALFWLEKGAKPSDTVKNLMADLGILKKSEKANKKFAKAKKKKELKAEAEGKAPEAKVEAPANTEEKTDAVEEKVEEAKPEEKPAEPGEDKKEEPKVEEKPEEKAEVKAETSSTEPQDDSKESKDDK